MKAPSEEIYDKTTQEIYVGYNSVAIFIRLAVVASQICEIPRNSTKILTYNSSKSSKVTDLDVNRKRICNFLLFINSNYERVSYSFRDIDAFSSFHGLFSPPHPCLTPRSGEPLRISGWNLSRNKKSQLTLSNPRDVKACQNCSNSTCFVSFHRIPFPQIANA